MQKVRTVKLDPRDPYGHREPTVTAIVKAVAKNCKAAVAKFNAKSWDSEQKRDRT